MFPFCNHRVLYARIKQVPVINTFVIHEVNFVWRNGAPPIFHHFYTCSSANNFPLFGVQSDEPQTYRGVKFQSINARSGLLLQRTHQFLSCLVDKHHNRFDLLMIAVSFLNAWLIKRLKPMCASPFHPRSCPWSKRGNGVNNNSVYRVGTHECFNTSSLVHRIWLGYEQLFCVHTNFCRVFDIKCVPHQ